MNLNKFKNSTQVNTNLIHESSKNNEIKSYNNFKLKALY